MATLAPRIAYERFGQVGAAAVRANLALGKAAAESGLEPAIIEFVKIRASQIDGCAFCLQMHLNDSRRMGIEAAKLDQLAAWRDASVYDARERAALAWTEALTLLASHHVGDADWEAVSAVFGEAEIVGLTAAIGAINTWNRFAVGFRFTPQAADAETPRRAEAA